MDGLFRRGGVWYARLIVPISLRAVVGKTELVVSTGVREPLLARVVAAELLAGWRRRLLDLSRILGGQIDAELISTGHPALSGGGHLPLSEAALASGIGEPHLLRLATEGKLGLFYRSAGLAGHLLGMAELDREFGPEGVTLIVPAPAQMSDLAVRTAHSGMLRLRAAPQSASAFLGDRTESFVLFDVEGGQEQFFAPLSPVTLGRTDMEVAVVEVERLRQSLAARISPAQIASAQLNKIKVIPTEDPRSSARLSEIVALYMVGRAAKCSPEQARRVRGALDLLVELEGDPCLNEMDSDRLDAFRDRKLFTVPANENKIRLRHGTTSIAASIQAVAGTDWPSISAAEQVKRLKWIAAMFKWCVLKRWLAHDPSALLVSESRASAAANAHRQRNDEAREQDARNLFTRPDLTSIFSTGSWYFSGRGELTTSGTYREFSPHYYWLPLIALFTGARINELSQLSLSDFDKTAAGTWFLKIARLDDDEDDPHKLKSRKNQNSRRDVPVHKALIEYGLIEWRNRLRDAGYNRLFPELKHDAVKGYGKAATKWFSGYLGRLGWERDGRKVFHSFRATLVSECVNGLGLTPQQTALISGHSTGTGATIERYIKDADVESLYPIINRLDFNLPPIAVFDCDAGLKSLSDALNRKRSRKPQRPD